MSKQQKCILFILGFFLLVPYLEYSGAAIRLERTGCFGFCPAYQVTIYSSGTVLYKGYGHVAIGGWRIAQIPRSKVNELIVELNKANFFDLGDEYEESMPDSPTFTISVRMGNKTKTVMRYGCGPQALIDLEYKIDEIANTDQWVGENSYLRFPRMHCP